MSFSAESDATRPTASLPIDYDTYLENERLTCAVEAALAVISGRWKVLIIRELLSGPKHFNQLHRALQGVSHKVLTQQLRDLEQDGILNREVSQSSPPRQVLYSLTAVGQSLHPIIHALHQWGSKYLRQAQSS